MCITEGGEEAESDGDNPPVANEEESNDDAEDLGDKDTEEKEFSDKESAAEKSSEKVEDSNSATTPKEKVQRMACIGLQGCVLCRPLS
ncbi:hypothetical protein HAX54_010149 [Datura stramonium]|uniref:Uncharacterized protein n=1 Tax=Datura stramonium TaxID=4076 RepID=A0ABS8WY93_DATST|nr:hypothetical protein [Datura stramonium]